jgi:putative sterol carrier protein
MIVEFVVAAGKKEQARSWARVDDDGNLAARGEGTPVEPADVTFTATPADAQALHEGTLDISVGFMRGQVKMAGDFGALLKFLPLTAGTAPQLAVAELLPA